MMSSCCHQMCMNEKVNQGPLYDINVWCNRSFKTKLHPIIVRQYSYLNPILLELLAFTLCHIALFVQYYCFSLTYFLLILFCFCNVQVIQLNIIIIKCELKMYKGELKYTVCTHMQPKKCVKKVVFKGWMWLTRIMVKGSKVHVFKKKHCFHFLFQIRSWLLWGYFQTKYWFKGLNLIFIRVTTSCQTCAHISTILGPPSPRKITQCLFKLNLLLVEKINADHKFIFVNWFILEQRKIN